MAKLRWCRRTTIADDISSGEMMRALDRDVKILGRGIEVGMALAANQFGLALAEGCPKDRRIFLRLGKTWLVVYNGVPKHVGHSVGMSYIALLLQAPGKQIHAAALRDLVSGDGDEADLGSAGKVADKKALKQYNARLAEIEEERAEARANNDLGRGELLITEREWYLEELRRAEGLGGKLREASSSDRERARKSVSAAIDRALEAIRKEHKPLWLHLRTYVDTGNFPCYRADQSTPWST